VLEGDRSVDAIKELTSGGKPPVRTPWHWFCVFKYVPRAAGSDLVCFDQSTVQVPVERGSSKVFQQLEDMLNSLFMS